MARSSVVDPLEKYRFILEWSSDTGSEGSALVRAGFHDIQMPKRSTNKINYREGTSPDIYQVSAGLTSMEDIQMSRGLLPFTGQEGANEFYLWMSAVHNPIADNGLKEERPSDASAYEYRKDVTIRMYDREGNIAASWKLFNAWPAGFNPGSDLNASEDGEKSLEQLTLAYEDFQQLDSSNEPVATSTSIPS